MVFVRTSFNFWKSVTTVSHFRQAAFKNSSVFLTFKNTFSNVFTIWHTFVGLQSHIFECINDLIKFLTKVSHISASCLTFSLNLWMFNGFAIALALEGHLRYFKAQKASEGNRFHKPDSQHHTEKHQKPINLTKMSDFLLRSIFKTQFSVSYWEAAKSNKSQNHRFPCLSLFLKPRSQYHTEKQPKVDIKSKCQTSLFFDTSQNSAAWKQR